MKYLLIGWLIVFSLGCSTTSQQPALHDFGWSASVAPQQEQGRALITVNAPTWLWDNRIRYRLLFASPSQVRFYGLDRWIASPPELFEQLLNSGGNTRNYALVVRLQSFEQQFDAPDRSRVILDFSVEAYSDDRKVGTREFHLQQPTKTPDAAGAISGFTDLSLQAVEKIQRWLEGFIAAES